MPAVIYKETGGPRDEVLSGPSGLINGAFDIVCYSDIYSTARSVATAIRQALDGYSGTVLGVKIEAIHLANENDEPTFPAGRDIIKRYAKRLNFRVWYKK